MAISDEMKSIIYSFKTLDLETQMNEVLYKFLDLCNSKVISFYDYLPKDMVDIFIDLVNSIYLNEKLNESALDEYQKKLFSNIINKKLNKRDIIFEDLNYRKFFNEEKTLPFLGINTETWEAYVQHSNAN